MARTRNVSSEREGKTTIAAQLNPRPRYASPLDCSPEVMDFLAEVEREITVVQRAISDRGDALVKLERKERDRTEAVMLLRKLKELLDLLVANRNCLRTLL